MPRVRKQAQIGFTDRMVDDSALLGLLEDRQKAKDARDRAKATYNGWDEKAKARVESLNLADGTHRCGAHVITLGRTRPRDVDFTTKGGERTIRIRAVKAAD